MIPFRLHPLSGAAPVASALVLGLVLGCTAAPPPSSSAPDRPPLVDSLEEYERGVEQDPSRRLVRLDRAVPGVRLDLRYATADNFMEEVLYPVAAAWLRAPAAEALAAVQRDLAADGLALKVYDAYRPYRVTVRMWEKIRDPDYVADPARGSRHNRGAAVDVTLVDAATGEELPMPTGYDDFTPRAHHSFEDLPAEARGNRNRLRAVMEANGFDPLPTEWWHYDFRGWEGFELLDLPLESLPEAEVP